MQISDNYLNEGHLPFERSRIDGQSATECHHAVHHMQITQALIPCNNGCIWHLPSLCPLKFPKPLAGQPPTSPTVGGCLRVWFGLVPAGTNFFVQLLIRSRNSSGRFLRSLIDC